MQTIIGIISWWALIGYLSCSILPTTKDRKTALKQTFWLGPVFWVAVPIWGIIAVLKTKLNIKKNTNDLL